MSLVNLSAFSTTFIVLSGLCLLAGWYAIKIRRQRILHRNLMSSATAFAALFLVFYVWRWWSYGSKPFAGEGIWRVIYLSVLFPHIVLAIAVGPMAARLIYLAVWTRNFAAHRRLARVVVPIWLFVASSGWFIYYLLYVVEF